MANDIADIVLNELKNKLTERERLSADRLAQVRRECPEIKALDVKIARAAIAGADAVQPLIAERNALVAAWLQGKGLMPEYLSPAPDCPRCGDTGYSDGMLCTCVRNETARRMFRDAGLTAGSPSFERFNLDLFPRGSCTDDGMPVREYMEIMRDFGQDYAKDFPEMEKPSLLFYGKPGRGKTYLMDCIAREVIQRGYWVVRATAYHVNDLMAKALVDKADPDSLFDCDLLVLDDLGSEPILNKVTISGFFNLFNERAAAGKPFLISTNLNPEELLQRYGDRIFSRITDKRTTRPIRFQGIDLRQRC